MADWIMIVLSIVVYVGGSAYLAFLFHHQQYKRYAEWCWEWRDRSAQYQESADRLFAEIKRCGQQGLEVQFLQLLYYMDAGNKGRTAKQAEHWERKLPRWCRAWYLRRYR